MVFCACNDWLCLSAIHDPPDTATIPLWPKHKSDPLTRHFLTHPTATPLHDLLHISLACTWCIPMVFCPYNDWLCLSAMHDPPYTATIPPCPNHKSDPLAYHFLTHPTLQPLHDLLDIFFPCSV
ncbi:MAG: hypothetical protein S4CHLAM81_03470 [Chlamydiales bacterium]|nr:hypothetical protein [Chlamydiales bacterium]